MPAAAVVLAAVLTAAAWAEPPETINLHGALTGPDGEPLAGPRAYVVRFYDAALGGIMFGPDLLGFVEVSDAGLFNLAVDLPADALAAAEVWYELGIDTDVPPDTNALDDLFPERVRVHSVPFALQAAAVTSVDASSIGNGSVANWEFESLDGALGPLQPQLDAKVDDADLDAHTGDTSNPHAVTAAQVGLGDVDNTADLSKPVSAAMQTALDAKADDADLAAHESGTSNPHAVTKAQVGLGSVDDTADLDKPVSTAAQAALDEKLPRASEAYIVVETAADAQENGTKLRETYAEAKALTPFESALSATNRAVVLVPPGNYDLGASPLTMDTDFVDLAGLSTARDDQYVYRADNVLVQTASNVRIENLVLHYTGSSTAIHAYYPNATWNDGTDHTGSPPQTRIRNCEFRATNRPMRTEVEYAGFYEDCTGGGYAFGGFYSTASGTFTNCTGGHYAFGGFAGTASGTFTNCTGGIQAFGGGVGVASGTFTNCTGGDGSFASYYGVASGTFTNCTGGSYAFGGDYGTASGLFSGCRMTGSSWGGTFGGRMEDCRWGTGFTCTAEARIYRSTILGNVNLNSTAAGIAHSAVKGTIQNAGSASFNTANLEDTDVN